MSRRSLKSANKCRRGNERRERGDNKEVQADRAKRDCRKILNVQQNSKLIISINHEKIDDIIVYKNYKKQLFNYIITKHF